MKALRIEIFIFFFLASLTATSQSSGNFSHDECTIGVASGNATSDGRPMVWKTRDYSSAPNNEVKYNTAYRYKFISVSNAGSSTYSWMGLNKHGFAIVNTLSSDLEAGSSGPSNGAFMRDVLGNCKTVAAFRHYLDSTNQSGRKTHADFGVIDSTGEAAIFETSGNNYWEFNADDSPHGYVIRTNFSMTGGGSTGIERYNRSSDLIAQFYAGDSLNLKSILRYQMRDFSDFDSNPVSVPFPHQWSPGIPKGYINTSKSICRNSSVSAAVIHGVLPLEQAGLSTMWTILGQPASSVALPYWPVVNTPVEADGESTAPLCDIARQIRSTLFDFASDDEYINSYKLRDGKGAGLWSCTFPFEDSVLTTTNTFMDSLRTLTLLPKNVISLKEKSLAQRALSRLKYFRQSLISGVPENKTGLIVIYPNPVQSGLLNIRYTLKKNAFVKIELCSAQGQVLMVLANEKQSPGPHVYQIHREVFRDNGVYLLIFQQDNSIKTVKIIVRQGK